MSFLPISHPFFNQTINHNPVCGTYHDGYEGELHYRVVVSADGGAHQFELDSSKAQLTFREILNLIKPELDKMVAARYARVGVVPNHDIDHEWNFDKVDAASITFFNGGITFNHVCERFYIEEFTTINLIKGN